ncbi:hypothetical protein ABXN37_01555 [Piscinibacter sakaiensis]|uniref:hypothetical protein n=1 Tax=Piscinibacter sakaiensis TaxID=1547922 RepID=UPI003727C940
MRNQDDELNLRIHRAGGRVWQSPAIRSAYAPRASFAALFRQFYQYGYWKPAVIRKHRLPASPRQLVPFGFVLLLALLALAAPFWPPAAAGLAWCRPAASGASSRRRPPACRAARRSARRCSGGCPGGSAGRSGRRGRGRATTTATTRCGPR